MRSTSGPWPAPARGLVRGDRPCARRLGGHRYAARDIDAVQALAAEGRAAAAPANRYYVAAATALQAWAAWRSGRAEDALSLGTHALELWDSQPVQYPFHCLALWPMIGTYLDAGETGNAIGAARRLLEPPQLRMPDELRRPYRLPAEHFRAPSPNRRLFCSEELLSLRAIFLRVRYG